MFRYGSLVPLGVVSARIWPQGKLTASKTFTAQFSRRVAGRLLDLPRFSGEALAHLPACFRIELGW
jgi:hypothetical protein